MQPSSKTIDELRAQVKTLTSQNEHKDALVLNCNTLGPLSMFLLSMPIDKEIETRASFEAQSKIVQ